MKILKTSFILLSLAGVWKPRGWRGIKAFIYYFYQFTVVISDHMFIISSILDLEFKNVDPSELFDNLSLLLAMTNARQKMSCVIIGRGAIKYIIDTLEKSPFKTRNNKEEVIAMKFDGLIRNIFVSYTLTTIGGIWLYSASRSGVLDPPHTLPYKGWFPYNYSNPIVYWLTASFQLYAINTANVVDLVLDLLISAILCSMCAQVHILKYRFKMMLEELKGITNDTDCSDIATTERLMIADWVEYHIDLINLIKYMNNVFSNVIFLQYTVSSVILCTLAFLMSHTDAMTMTFAGYFGFLITIYFQVFQQCYCAHTLTSEATTGIYDADWPSLSNNIRRSVVIIMCKSYRPILITSSFFIILSLESFTKIIKLAYTIYNVLS
ncbi:GSCOCT00010241001.3-RA-CDS [Cotesia congregata]|uniref:Odorant receptor n=1 Tax=Cotesia congregata TaxID=51543 RepID=A0A8J2H8C2_COTCN|nr:GSCOCT00010241001.3-RA-CDS [Cotesia congregata]CAG5082902.1 olfactory receptor 194 [Cotesia congregata]